jgi:hypothetical protein
MKTVQILNLFQIKICSKLKFVQIQKYVPFKIYSNSNLFKLENCSKYDKKGKFFAELTWPIWERLQAFVGYRGRRIGAPSTLGPFWQILCSAR